MRRKFSNESTSRLSSFFSGFFSAAFSAAGAADLSPGFRRGFLGALGRGLLRAFGRALFTRLGFAFAPSSFFSLIISTSPDGVYGRFERGRFLRLADRRGHGENRDVSCRPEFRLPAGPSIRQCERLCRFPNG